jgi:hypothetical protein
VSSVTAVIHYHQNSHGVLSDLESSSLLNFARS